MMTPEERREKWKKIGIELQEGEKNISSLKLGPYLINNWDLYLLRYLQCMLEEAYDRGLNAKR